MLSWYWVPNNQHPSFHKLVLCTQHQQLLGSVVYPTFFQKRSSMRKESFLPQGFFSCPKNKPVMAVFKFLKQVQQIMTIFEMFDLKLGQMLHNPTVVYPTKVVLCCLVVPYPTVGWTHVCSYLITFLIFGDKFNK